MSKALAAMSSSSGLSNKERKAQNIVRLQASRSKGKERARDDQAEIRASLPFDVPTLPDIHLVKSRYGPKTQQRLPEREWPSIVSRQLTPIPHNGSVRHAAIPNDNYIAGSAIPQYTAIRFGRAVTAEQADELLRIVGEMKKLKQKFETTAAHGNDFMQAWFGIWQRYASKPHLAAKRRPEKPALDAAISKLFRALDTAMKSSAAWLRQVDPATYNRTLPVHAIATQAVVEGARGGHMYSALDKKWLDKDTARSKPAFHRMAGLGCMLAVSLSTGRGTAYHYDNKDDGMLLFVQHTTKLTRLGHHYSAILVLGEGGSLKLPETGMELSVRPGDVVFFLANQQLHKLDISNDSLANAGSQTVFTIWSDKPTLAAADPSAHGRAHPDFFTVMPEEDEVEVEFGGNDGD
ncbi:hypothetical protein NX059_012219 [Plenodomus lindquistii]|nr:hypothetical protein NX059_012219 [Plenodomus lindquistii]